MRQFIRVLTMVFALAGLAACATDYHPTPHWLIRDTSFQELKPGVSTTADARRIIGEPLSTMRFPMKGEEVWEYRYLLGGGTIVMKALVTFDLQGVYKSTFHMLDPAFHGSADK